MEQLLVQLLPILDAGGSIALIVMLKVAWSIYGRLVAIEKELGIHKVHVENIKDKVDTLEERLDGYTFKKTTYEVRNEKNP